MPDRTVNAVRHQLMTFADFEGLRPVLPQVQMRAPKEPEGCNHKDCAAPMCEGRQVIIGKRKPRRKQIHDWKKKSSRYEDKHQRLFQRVHMPYHHFIVFYTLLKQAANGHVNNEAC